MRFRRHIELKKGRLDIAPLIDVVFLLLIFFMLTSNFISQQGIKVNLPSALNSKALSQKELVIFITDKDSLMLDGEKIDLARLNSTVKKAFEGKRRILIKSDKNASMGRVVEIWDLCREVGITDVSIATAQKDN